MDTLLQDLRYAARTLARTPGFGVAIVLVLTLGIAANTAIFGLVNNVLLRPLPFEDPDRLVQLYETFPLPGGGSGTGSVSVPNYVDWREQSTAYEDLALSSFGGSANLQSGGEPERLATLTVGTNLFSVLRAQPLLGRAMSESDENVVVLSEALWQRRFAGDRAIIGRDITLDGTPHTIIGVMPGSFRFPVEAGSAVDAWLPLRLSEGQLANRGSHAFRVIGRLRDGVTPEAAETELRQIAARVAELFPAQQEGRSAQVVPLRQVALGTVRTPLLVLLGASAFVLLIACANAANLLLARATVRSREVTIRAALGATRGRLARQFMVESSLLTLIAATLGVLLAWWGSEAVAAVTARLLPVEAGFVFDARVLLFLIGVATFTVFIFGLAPALHGARADLQTSLRDGGRQGSSGRGHGARSLLVITQVAMSVVLLVGAGLLMRTFVSLMTTETGMRTDNVLTMNVVVPPGRFEGGSYAQFYAPVLERTRALAGVQEAGAVSHLPLRDWGFNGNFGIVGRTFATTAEMPFAEFRAATPGYFGALGIPALRGRTFTEDDMAGAPGVVVVNQTLARRWFPDSDPVGQQLDFGTPVTIIGVVADIRQIALDAQPAAELYFPYAQVENFGVPLTLVVATSVEPLSMVPAIRDVVRSADPTQPIFAVMTMRQVVRASVSDRTLYLWLLGGFAAVALLLAVAGIYGVISYTVTQRTQEIGIRIALGSEPDAVRRLVIWQGARLALVGLVVGVLGAAGITRIIASLLHGVTPTDPLTFLIVALGLTTVAVLASYVPARRAARVSPMIALRAD